MSTNPATALFPAPDHAVPLVGPPAAALLEPPAQPCGPPEPPAQPSALSVPPAQPCCPPRLRRPDRWQMTWEPTCLDQALAADHAARTLWAVTEKLDLSVLYAAIEARGSEPGRAAIEPRLLVALWLLAYSEGVGNGRELERLCQTHDAYRWMCGGVSVNYHTLNDFRVGQAALLDQLFTDVLAALLHGGVLQVERISQDGTKVRAAAGTGSFRSRQGLERCRDQARAHVEAMKQQAAENPAESARRRAARERAARDRLARVEQALAEMPKMEATKAAQRDDKASKQQTPRVSSTDPEARRMKMPNGGFNPAYNVQIASDAHSRAIVGIEVTQHGTDHGEDAPMRAQVERRSASKVKGQTLDGGYVKLDAIEQAATQGVAIYAPLPKLGKDGTAVSGSPKDKPGVAAWRARMSSAAGQAIYKERGATSETINADLKTFRGLSSFPVRGLQKCRCVALWAALAYNLMHFAEVLLAT
jgi:transposase